MVDYCFKGSKRTLSLKRLSDTKITRYVKTQCNANPFDPEWKEYYDKRETYKMLISLKGRESLLGLWKKQKRVCPICNDPIDKGKEWYLASINSTGKPVKSLVHISCCRKINNLSIK